MSWASYYNHALFGDVLLLIYEPEKRPFSYQKKGNVVAIYDDQQVLIGVNIFAFSSIMKMKAKGRIPFFPLPVFNVINNVLKNAALPPLENQTSSGFFIMTVKEILDDSMVLSYQNQTFKFPKIAVEINDQLLVASPGTILFNGKRVENYQILKENDMEFTSSTNYILFHQEKEEDFFLR